VWADLATFRLFTATSPTVRETFTSAVLPALQCDKIANTLASTPHFSNGIISPISISPLSLN
jgi:hypothetical protein